MTNKKHDNIQRTSSFKQIPEETSSINASDTLPTLMSTATLQ